MRAGQCLEGPCNPLGMLFQKFNVGGGTEMGELEALFSLLGFVRNGNLSGVTHECRMEGIRSDTKLAGPKDFWPHKPFTALAECLPAPLKHCMSRLQMYGACQDSGMTTL